MIIFMKYRHAFRVRHNAAAVQIPIGLEDQHDGVVDLIRMEAIYFEGDMGTNVVTKPIPADLQELAEEKHNELIEILADIEDGSDGRLSNPLEEVELNEVGFPGGDVP